VSFPPLVWRVGGNVAVDVFVRDFRLSRSLKATTGRCERHFAIRLLLHIAARADFVVAIRVRRGIVLVVVDRLAHVVLLPVDLLAFLGSERAAGWPSGRYESHCSGRLRGPPGFSFAGSELTGGDPVGNASLLVVAASIHRIHRRRGGAPRGFQRRVACGQGWRCARARSGCPSVGSAARARNSAPRSRLPVNAARTIESLRDLRPSYC